MVSGRESGGADAERGVGVGVGEGTGVEGGVPVGSVVIVGTTLVTTKRLDKRTLKRAARVFL